MLFIPVNKQAHIERVYSPKKTKSVGGFVVPEETLQLPHCVVKVIRLANDFTLNDITEGDLVVVQRALIDEIRFDDKTYHTISQNGIVARLQESDFA